MRHTRISIRYLHLAYGGKHACSRPKVVSLKGWKSELSLRSSRPFSRFKADRFVCFLRHRARLPRRHTERACTVACPRARAAADVVDKRNRLQFRHVCDRLRIIDAHSSRCGKEVRLCVRWRIIIWCVLNLFIILSPFAERPTERCSVDHVQHTCAHLY